MMNGSQSSHALLLVVERDPHVRRLEQYFLVEAGFTVEFAADGAEALARAQVTLPKILISEILVPRVDGLAVCRILKSRPETASIRVVLFSILSAAERAREAGADAFVRKPLDEKLLIGTVRELLARPEGEG